VEFTSIPQQSKIVILTAIPRGIAGADAPETGGSLIVKLKITIVGKMVVELTCRVR